MSGPRYSIIPAAAVVDPRLQGQDLRVLALLGVHTADNGWCRRSQVRMADQLGCARSTIQAALTRLMQAGWVEYRAEDRRDGGTASHWYRVRLDVAEADAAAAGASRLIDGADEGLAAAEAPPAGIPAGPAGPEPAGPAGPGPAPLTKDSNEADLTPPPIPPRGAERVRARDGQGRRSADAEPDPEVVAAFDRWFAAWPDAHVHRRETALREWLRLSEGDRALAVEATARFLQDQARAGKLRKYAPSTFLADGIFRRVPRQATSGPAVREVADVVPWSREGWWFVHLWARQPYGSAARQRLSEMLGGWPGGRLFRVFRDELPTVQQLEAMVSIPADGDDARAWREHYFPPGLAVPEWRRHVDLPKPRGGGWMFVPARRPEEVVA